MTEPRFTLGEDVTPYTGPRGNIIEHRWINDTEWIYGIETNGAILYHRETSIRPSHQPEEPAEPDA